MATTYKTFLNNDRVATRTLLHESIPITGTMVSGTYSDKNIKSYAHGMFQSVYDYPYLSSSANHIFDITFGYHSDSALSGTNPAQNSKKVNIYNQMAQVLMGYNSASVIQKFDADGNILGGGTKHTACYFLNFARLLTKDEIKKGSFSISYKASGSWTTADSAAPGSGSHTLTDSGAENSFKVNSPAGEYGILKNAAGNQKGLIFYQAGMIAMTSSIMSGSTTFKTGSAIRSGSFAELYTSGTIDEIASNFRRRLIKLSFNNTTELNSSIYFCRVNHNNFNYSSNPTYVSSSKIVVKNSTMDNPVTYITSVGLYSSDNELLATAKLSEPLKKTPENEMTLRVRLDY